MLSDSKGAFSAFQYPQLGVYREIDEQAGHACRGRRSRRGAGGLQQNDGQMRDDIAHSVWGILLLGPAEPDSITTIG